MIKEQFLKFIIFGVLSTFVNYSVFFVLYKFFSLHYSLAYIIGFIAGIFLAYTFNKKWTFRIKENTKKYILKYFFVYIVSMILGLFCLKFLVNYLGVIAEISNVIIIGMTTCTNFLGVKFWVFRK